jgi:predicted transcriptional regulator
VNTEEVNPHLTAKIVVSYVRHHRLEPDQLSDLITSIRQAMGQLAQPAEPVEVLAPAVSVRRSVHRDYVVCLDCGYRGKTLRRHIETRHGLSTAPPRRKRGASVGNP